MKVIESGGAGSSPVPEAPQIGASALAILPGAQRLRCYGAGLKTDILTDTDTSTRPRPLQRKRCAPFQATTAGGLFRQPGGRIDKAFQRAVRIAIVAFAPVLSNHARHRTR